MYSLQSSSEHRTSYDNLLVSANAVNTTRIIFLLAGLCMAAWAPLVPLVKNRFLLTDDVLGLLLISIAVGSLLTMPIAAYLIEKFSCKTVIILGLAITGMVLPLLMTAPMFSLMLLLLFFFGVGLGLVDIAMNTQAVILEKASSKPIMSSMHAFWSIGGVVGSAIVTFLLWLKLSPIVTMLAVAILVLCALFPFYQYLLPKPPYTESDKEKTPFFVLPKGMVLLLGVLCFILFLAEGAMLDWSAIFLQDYSGISQDLSGSGFIIFSIAMTIGRITGDKIVAKFGRFYVLAFGVLLSASGYFLLSVIPMPYTAYIGLTLIGLGAANAVPIIFTAAGNQKEMSAQLAIAAVAMVGYGGMLIGPTIVGIVSEQIGLDKAFLLISILLLVVVAFSRKVTRTLTS